MIVTQPDHELEPPSPLMETATYWLEVMREMTPRERRVFTKIVCLAKNEQSRPVHIIMAMAKANTFAVVGNMAHAVVAYRVQMAIAKFWNNIEKRRMAEAAFKGFLVACDSFTQGLDLAEAERKRRLTVVNIQPACPPQCHWQQYHGKKHQGQQYQGKSVPFGVATPLRNRVAAFKHAR